jgi:phospholipid-binding lipoprotein MlaA
MAVLCTVRKSSLFLLCSFTFSLIGGCAAINQGDFAAHEKFEKTNRASFRVSERIDKWVFRPISKGYSVVVPEPAQAGVTNFFNNVRDIDSSLNGFL